MPYYKRDFLLSSESVATASTLLQIKKSGSDTGDFLFREFGIDRQREAMFAQCFCDWEVAWSITEMRVCLLKVNRHRIMNRSVDPEVLQARAHAIPLWRFNHVAMPNAF